MTLFGRTFDGQEVFALVSMLAVLVLWIGALRGQRGYARWMKGWEADRKARKDAEDNGGAPPANGSRGPWG